MLCWNYERYISQCLNSIFSQTHKDLEVLFLDNASSDNSFQKAEAVLKKSGFAHQVYRNETPQSVPKNFNFLIKKATGEFVFPFSADDWMAPENLEQKIALLVQRPNVGLVFGGGWYYFEHTDTYLESDSTKYKRGNMVNNLLLDRASYFHPGPAYRRKIIEEVGGWDESLLVEDLDLNLRVAMKYEVDFVPTPLVYYRRHASSFLSNYKLMNEGFQQYLKKYKSHKHLPMDKWMASNYKFFSLEALSQKQYGLSLRFLGRSLKTAPGFGSLATVAAFVRVYFSKFEALRKIWIPFKTVFSKQA